MAVSQLSGRLINLQVKCVCSASHPPRSWLCWRGPEDAVWGGERMAHWRGREAEGAGQPAAAHKEPSIASVPTTYTVFRLHAYQWRRAKYYHSSSADRSHKPECPALPLTCAYACPPTNLSCPECEKSDFEHTLAKCTLPWPFLFFWVADGGVDPNESDVMPSFCNNLY